MDSHSLLQGIVPIQGLNPGFLHCRWILDYWATWEACRVTIWPSNSTLRYILSRNENTYPRKTLNTNVHNGIIHNSQKVETTQISLNRWIDKVWCIHRIEYCCSVAQSCLTHCNPMDCSTPGLPVHHQLLEFTHTHVHRVGDAIKPSHPLSSPSPAFNLAQHQGLFQRVGSLHQVAKGLEFHVQHQSFQWTFRTDFL